MFVHCGDPLQKQSRWSRLKLQRATVSDSGSFEKHIIIMLSYFFVSVMMCCCFSLAREVS